MEPTITSISVKQTPKTVVKWLLSVGELVVFLKEAIYLLCMECGHSPRVGWVHLLHMCRSEDSQSSQVSLASGWPLHPRLTLPFIEITYHAWQTSRKSKGCLGGHPSWVSTTRATAAPLPPASRGGRGRGWVWGLAVAAQASAPSQLEGQLEKEVSFPESLTDLLAMVRSEVQQAINQTSTSGYSG